MAFWNARSTYTRELERQRDFWQKRALSLERDLATIQSARVADAQLVTDAFARTAGQLGVHDVTVSRETDEERPPAPDDLFEIAEAQRAKRVQVRMDYAAAHNKTIGEVEELCRLGFLSTEDCAADLGVSLQ